MARILIDNQWYEEVSPDSFYEADFERIVLQHAPRLYPGFSAVPFKQIVYSETSASRPDMALIDQDYRDWWVVEVEMGHHSLDGHVVPQVTTLAQATYGASEAECLCLNAPHLSKPSLLEMMKGRPPQVLVIVNTPRPEWERTLLPLGAHVAVLEVFRSSTNRHVFRANGYVPSRVQGIISLCHFDPVLPRFLMVESPALLSMPPRARIDIKVDGRSTLWERVDSQDRVWLVPVAANPLKVGRKYDLIRLIDGTLELRQAST